MFASYSRNPYRSSNVNSYIVLPKNYSRSRSGSSPEVLPIILLEIPGFFFLLIPLGNLMENSHIKYLQKFFQEFFR